MRRIALVAGILLVAGAVAMLRLRTQWIDRKVAAATLAPTPAEGDGPGCERDGAAVVITGDSRIAQWPMRLFDGLSIANRGVAGETALQLAARFDRDVLLCRPRAVLIAAGINDLVAASLAAAPQAQAIVARLPGLLSGLAEKAAQAGAMVSIATIVPPARPDLLRRLVWSEAVRGYAAEVNARLRAQPWPGAVTLVDFAAALDPRDAGVLPDRFRRDTLHLNASAYRCLTRLLPFTRSATSFPSSPCMPGEEGWNAGRDERGGMARIAAER